VPSREQSACESLADKGAAYGIPGVEVDGNDVLACLGEIQAAVRRARTGGGPTLVVLRSYRMLGHSSSDDPSKYRDAAEVAAGAARDPLARFERYLVARGVLRAGERAEIEQQLLAEIDAVIREQEAAPPMPLKTLVEDVYADVPRHLKRQYNDFVRVAERLGQAQPGDGAFPL
jgi:TPP-dependent pyruvate/acetoin dehydrogenase alpha subunit